MRQPFAVNFDYMLTIVTNKYELLNEFNELVHYHFKALQCYIFPNEHPMSMILNSVSDESEYALDDRKFYSQTFNITLRGYIIRKEDFEITHMPSRVIFMTEGDKFSRKNTKKKKSIEAEEIYDPCKVEEIDNRYYYKTIEANIYFDGCNKEKEFITDFGMTISTIQTKNVYDFRMFINEEVVDFNNTEEVEIMNGDKIKFLIEKDTLNKDSKITIIGYDKNVILDREEDIESSLDEPTDEEIIDIE